MTLAQLQQTRAAKAAKAGSILRAIANGDDVSPETRAEGQALETEVAALDVRIASSLRADELERRAPATPVNGTRDFAAAVGQFNVRAFIAHHAGIETGEDVGRELEVSRELRRRNPAGGETQAPLAAIAPPERRTLTWGGGSGSGAGLVAEQALPGEFISGLYPALITGGLGARVIDGLVGGPIGIGKQAQSMQAAWIAEDSPLTRNDGDLDKVQLTPKHVGGVGSISRNMLLQTSPAASGVVQDDLRNVIAGAVDWGALVGGTSNAPSGVFDAISPTTVGDPTWAKILGFIESVELANAAGARLGWAGHPSTVRKLRSTTHGFHFGSPAQPDAGAGAQSYLMSSPRELAGYPLAASTQLPLTGSPATAGSLAFGDWSQLVIGVWESVSLLINPYTESDFLRGGVAIRALATVDVAIRHEAAFAVATDVTL